MSEDKGTGLPERLQYNGNGLRLMAREALDAEIFDAAAFKGRDADRARKTLSECHELVGISALVGGAGVYSGVVRHTGRRRDAYVVIVSIPGKTVNPEHPYSAWAFKFVGDSNFGISSAEKLEVRVRKDDAGNYLALR